MVVAEVGAVVSLGQRIRDLAQADPDREALVFVPRAGAEQRLTHRELDHRSDQVADMLRAHGVGVGDRVAIGLRNCPEHIIATLGAWKTGAGIVTMRYDVPDWERDRLLDVTAPKVILAEREGVSSNGTPVLDVAAAQALPGLPAPTQLPPQPMAIPTGGSTGASKAVVLPVPGAMAPGSVFGPNYDTFGIPPVERHLVYGPLYHSNPLIMVHAGLFDGQQVILLEGFDGQLLLETIARHRPDFITLVPTVMKRLLDFPGVEQVDWSCFHMVLHGTAPCPAWLKRRWIELVGAERLWEVFASSELVGSIVVRGDEWLTRPGTVGRPTASTELRILDDQQRELPVGEVGEIYTKIKGVDKPLFDYLGQDRPRVTEDGFVSVGDMGRVDEDGFLFPADRKGDLIISGGANVVPAEVEAALHEHPDVMDVAVIGLPDEEWGQRVHAVVQPRDPASPPKKSDLIAFAKERLASYKAPKSIELVDELPRTEMFKIRRSALAAERS